MVRITTIGAKGTTILDDLILYGYVPATGVSGVPLPAALRFDGCARGFVLALPQAAHADVRAYDVAGREVAVLADGPLEAGQHRFELATRRLPSGVYFARAVVDAATGRVMRTARTVVVH